MRAKRVHKRLDQGRVHSHKTQNAKRRSQRQAFTPEVRMHMQKKKRRAPRPPLHQHPTSSSIQRADAARAPRVGFFFFFFKYQSHVAHVFQHEIRAPVLKRCVAEKEGWGPVRVGGAGRRMGGHTKRRRTERGCSMHTAPHRTAAQHSALHCTAAQRTAAYLSRVEREDLHAPVEHRRKLLRTQRRAFPKGEGEGKGRGKKKGKGVSAGKRFLRFSFPFFFRADAFKSKDRVTAARSVTQRNATQMRRRTRQGLKGYLPCGATA